MPQDNSHPLPRLLCVQGVAPTRPSGSFDPKKCPRTDPGYHSYQVRDRPMSAKAFKEVASNDHELKIFEKHSLVRRMPLTEDAEKWLNEKEKERVKMFEEKVKKLKEDFAAKSDKKGDKGGKDDKKDTKKTDKNAVPEEPPKIKPKYKSAAQFMQTFFPVFDLNGQSSFGPMRTQQLTECDQIATTFEFHGLEIDKDVLRRALMIPQDKYTTHAPFAS